MKAHSSPQVFVLIAIAFLTFVVSHAVSTWNDAVTEPWANLNTDQYVIGSIFDKLNDPDSLQRDYILHNKRSYEYYTPSFVLLLQNTNKLTNESFIKSLAFWQWPTLALYLLAAYLLFHQLSESVLVGFVLALLSIKGYSSLKDFWAVVGLENILARTIALPVILFACFTFFRPLLFPEGSIRWLWAVTGVLIGVIANIHPPTGIAFALVLGITALLSWKLIGRKRTSSLSLLVIGAVISGAPIIFHTLQSSEGVEIPDFAAFAKAFTDRVSMFPFQGNGYGRIAALRPDYQLVFGFLWLPLTLISLLAIKLNRRSWTFWPFLLVQIAYFLLLVSDYYSLHLNAIAITVVFYAWHWGKRNEKHEMIWLYFLASIIFVSYFLAVALRACWLTFGIEALTTLVSQLPRGARLLTIPILLIGARLARDLLMRWQAMPSKSMVWIEFLVMLSLARFDKFSGVHLVLALLFLQRNKVRDWQVKRPAIFAIWGGLSAFAAGWLVLGSNVLIPMLVGTVIGSSIWLTAFHSLQYHSAVLGVCATALILIVFVLTIFSPDSIDEIREIVLSSATSIVAATVLGAGLFLLFDRPDNHIRDRLTVYILVPLLIATSMQLLSATKYFDLSTDTGLDPTPEYLVGKWARENTSVNALFFTSNLDGSAFRFWSQRSIVMSYKDLGVFVAFSRSSELAILTERWRRLAALSGDEILSDPDAATADYVIIRSTDEPLSRPIVYRDDYSVVYSLESDMVRHTHDPAFFSIAVANDLPR